MTEIFADAIGSIAVSNGVARIELVQLRKTKVGKARLLPEPVAMLFVPATGLQQMTQQLVEAARALQKQETARAERAEARAEAAKDAGAADEALTNL